MKPDNESLGAWYRTAMVRRIDELRALRAALANSDPAAGDAARAVGQALRGSGATFGFPEVSAMAGLVETAGEPDLRRRVEGLIEILHRVRTGNAVGGPVRAEWLAIAAGIEGPSQGFPDVATAWREVARVSGTDEVSLVARASAALGIEAADLSRPQRAPLRLVPEALMVRELVLPLSDDSERVTVASADPTSLRVESELLHLTGRAPVFVLASPEALGRTLSQLLATPALPSRPRAVRVADEERVLLVDDDPGARLMARSVLEKGGFRVVEAGDGVEALEALGREGSVSLVVADLNMPRMDGLELVWEIRDQPELAGIPILVLTGETDDVLEAKLIDEGADDYLCKPLDPRLFLARVGATIRRVGA